MGLTQKILVFVSLIVVALVGISLAFTTIQADRLAHESLTRGLSETRGVWETFQADRYSKLKQGVRVLGNDAAFKAAIATDQATVYDLLQERGKDLAADFFIATDPAGVVIARSDRPGAQGTDLSKDPVVMKPLEGEESATVWRQGDRLFHAVSVPMQFGADVVGVLIAGYGINENLAGDIRKLTHSEIAYLTQQPGQPPQLSVSTLGPKEDALKAALASAPFAAGGADHAEPFELSLRGERHVAVQVPLKAATGETVGSVVALRSLSEEMASFRRFRNSLVLVSLVVMGVALAVAYVASSRITGPVRHLASLVERARSGSFTGAVAVETSDEIGVLARNFNSLLADLREKEQMIGFLREGLTMMKKKASGATAATAPTQDGLQTTAALEAVTVAPPGAAVQKGDVFASRYEVLGTVGKGGMGVVYRARDRQLDEVVALKVLRKEMMLEDTTLLDRFKQETRLARRISHRNVLRTHDFGEADGTPYISMEYLEGVTLKDLLKSKGALPSGVGLSIAKQICQGLEAAHRLGVVHRDIKPQNMLILPETGELKIMDFGIARVSSMEPGASGLTTAGTVMGTPDYMPPEQAQGGAADFRSDIYSLGIVFYEMFTGKLPFTGDTVMKIILGHIQTPPVPPRQLNGKVAVELEAVILRCMEKEPSARYQKVEEVLDGLTEVSTHVETSAA
jgi:eukaryotic-like serine/threonine-protein kinase